MIINSSICVATTTGRPIRRAASTIRFCSGGTSSGGISTPRSPRATITASASSRMSSSRSIAAGFSILASRFALPPISRRASATSSGRCTKERAIQSTCCSSAKARSARSFSVSAASGSTTSGTLRPLLLEIVPPTSTLASIRSASAFDHPEDELAVVDQQPRAGLRPPRKSRGAASWRALSSPGAVVAVEDEGLAGLQLGLVALEPADPQLRPLQVGEDRGRPVELAFQRADRRDPPLVIGMAAVAHVDPEGVGAGLDQPADHRRASRWPGRASPGSAPCGCAGAKRLGRPCSAWPSAIAARHDSSTGARACAPQPESMEHELAEGSIAADELRLLIERIERLEEEKKAIADDVKDVYAEAKARGYDAKTCARSSACGRWRRTTARRWRRSWTPIGPRSASPDGGAASLRARAERP